MIQNSPVDNGTSEGIEKVPVIQGTVTFDFQFDDRTRKFSPKPDNPLPEIITGFQLLLISTEIGLIKYRGFAMRIHRVFVLMWCLILLTAPASLVAWFVYLFSYKVVTLESNEPVQKAVFPVADYLVGLMGQLFYIISIISIVIKLHGEFLIKSQKNFEKIVNDILLYHAKKLRRFSTTVVSNLDFTKITVSVKN